MPVLETDFLKALIDPEDALHLSASRILPKLRKGELAVSAPAFIELDLLLKSHQIPPEDRSVVFRTLSAEIPARCFLPLTPAVMVVAIAVQRKYHFSDSYFDSLYLASAILHDGHILSSDSSFARIQEVEATHLRSL